MKEKRLFFMIRDLGDLVFLYLLIPPIEHQESEAREVPLSSDKAVYLLLEVSAGESGPTPQDIRLGSYVIYAACLLSRNPVMSSWYMKEKEVAMGV